MDEIEKNKKNASENVETESLFIIRRRGLLWSISVNRYIMDFIAECGPLKQHKLVVRYRNIGPN